MSKKDPVIIDAVFINKLYHMAIQNAPALVKSEMYTGYDLLTDTKKSDLKKAFVAVDIQIEQCKQLARKNKSMAYQCNAIARRLMVARTLIGSTLSECFAVTCKKKITSVAPEKGMMDKAFVEQIYRASVGELPDDVQKQLHVRKDDLLISSKRNNEKGWAQAYELLDRQIKLCNKNAQKEVAGNSIYPFVARRLEALQTMVGDTLKGEFGIVINQDEKAKDIIKDESSNEFNI